MVALSLGVAGREAREGREGSGRAGSASAREFRTQLSGPPRTQPVLTRTGPGSWAIPYRTGLSTWPVRPQTGPGSWPFPPQAGLGSWPSPPDGACFPAAPLTGLGPGWPPWRGRGPGRTSDKAWVLAGLPGEAGGPGRTSDRAWVQDGVPGEAGGQAALQRGLGRGWPPWRGMGPSRISDMAWVLDGLPGEAGGQAGSPPDEAGFPTVPVTWQGFCSAPLAGPGFWQVASS
jgi:hypothetical protein